MKGTGHSTEYALWRLRWALLAAMAGAAFAAGLRRPSEPAYLIVMGAIIINGLLIVPLAVRPRNTPWVTRVGWALDVVVPFAWLLALPAGTLQPDAFWLLLYSVVVTAERADWLWAMAVAIVSVGGNLLHILYTAGQLPDTIEGLLAFYTPHFAGAISFLVVSLLSALAICLVRSAMRHTAEQQQERLLRDRAEAEAFRKLLSVVAGQEGYQAVLYGLSATLCSYLGDDNWFSLVLLFDQEREGAVRIVTGWNCRSTDLNRTIAPIPTPLERVLATGQSVLFDQAESELRSIDSLSKVRTIILLPLQVGIDGYGVVILASRGKGQVSPETMRFLNMLCQIGSLVLHNAQIRQVLQRSHDEVITDQEGARRQLARDLHDGPVQTVAAMSMEIEYIKALLRREPDKVPAELDELYEMSKKASHSMRTLLFTLRPVMLEKEGLAAALKHLVDRLRTESGLNIHFENLADDLRLRPEVEETAFAVLEEALNNAKKHASQATIVVRLLIDGHFLVGQVEDNGPGFDVSSVLDSYHERTSLGILNMKERAALIDAVWNLESTPGKGTTVTLAIPISS